MKVSELCRARRLAKVSKETPMLVPSYSSRGFFPETLLQETENYYVDVKLLSAYDIHYKLVKRKHIPSTDLVFVDSGHYEVMPTHSPGEPYEDERRGAKPWSHSRYERVLDSLRGQASRIIRVTYDRYLPVHKQFEHAKASLARFPSMLTDFLVKPERKIGGKPNIGPLVDPGRLGKIVPYLGDFDVVGFTEKELGPSYLERAATIAAIRQSLNKAGVESPVHIFGCLDPLGVLLYQSVGADIFDGLTWLRFDWNRGQLGYIPSGVAQAGHWRDNLEWATRLVQAGNLSRVRELQAAARSLARDGGFQRVEPPWREFEPLIQSVLRELDIEMEAS